MYLVRRLLWTHLAIVDPRATTLQNRNWQSSRATRLLAGDREKSSIARVAINLLFSKNRLAPYLTIFTNHARSTRSQVEQSNNLQGSSSNNVPTLAGTGALW